MRGLVEKVVADGGGEDWGERTLSLREHFFDAFEVRRVEMHGRGGVKVFQSLGDGKGIHDVGAIGELDCWDCVGRYVAATLGVGRDVEFFPFAFDIGVFDPFGLVWDVLVVE